MISNHRNFLCAASQSDSKDVEISFPRLSPIEQIKKMHKANLVAPLTMVELPYIPHHVILEHIFPFIDAYDMEKNVYDAVQSRNLSDLYFMVGRTKVTVPTFVSNNEIYSEKAGLHSILLPVLRNLGFKLSNRLFQLAAEKGNIKILDWLRDNDCPWHEQTFLTAINHGDLYLCMWLKRDGCPWDASTFFMAAGKNSKLHILQWLQENGCPWDEQTYYPAVMEGNLDAVRWLRENGCPWDEQTFLAAALQENLDLMKWLLLNNCPWDYRTFDAISDSAISDRGNNMILEWLIENHCPTEEDDEDF